ncbi:aldehyde dehydrogenase family protein [Patescibacteria group bacterium AH-259-L07]|nr:aldehyde dehydrogenase family protein [Patescibacteria group bacterium AH-259-L07]
MTPERYVETEAKHLSQVFNRSRSSEIWSLKTRTTRWLQELDSLIKEYEDTIVNTVADEIKQDKDTVFIDQYIPIRILIRGYRRWAYKVLCDENRSKPSSLLFAHKKSIIKKEPWGVVGIITPTNSPFSIPLGNIIPALLAGNSAVLKPAEGRKETTNLLRSLVKRSLIPFGQNSIFAVLPPEVEYGEALNSSLLVDKVSFTGSDKAGWKVHQANARDRFAPVTLELGGSNPAIVLEDADIERAASVIVWARFSDISCNNIKRVFAVKQIYDELLKEIKQRVDRLQPHEIDCNCSDLETENYKRFLQDVGIERAVIDKVRPIVIELESLGEDLPFILKEETFVPILPVVKVKDAEEAVAMANATRFGLGASIFTKDRKQFEALANRIECQGVFHNDAMTEFAMAHIPFGGWKSSGVGYTHGPEGLLEFVRIKEIETECWFANSKFVRFLTDIPLYPRTEKKMKWLRKFADLLIKFG